MKKVLLSIASLFVLTSAIAQTTNCDLAQNLPNGAFDGFTFNWEPSSPNDVGVLNCMQAAGALGTSGIYGDIFGAGSAGYSAAGYAVSHDGTNFHIQTNGTTPASTPLAFRLPQANCGSFQGTAGSALDLSIAADRRIELNVKSDVAVTITPFLAVLNGGFTYVDGHATDPAQSISVPAGGAFVSYVVSMPTKSWDNVTQPVDKVIGLGFTITPTTSTANITFQYIKIGTVAAALTPTQSINLSEALTVSPNPASDAVNIDLSKIGVEAGATAKLTSTTGVVVMETAVTEENFSMNVSNLNEGIYILQITSGNKVATKKVVVQ
jgi:hypothetical protein